MKKSVLRHVLAAGLCLGGGLAAQAQDGGDAAAGERVFRKCMACHAVGADATNKIGPVLNGVVDRQAAVIEDFAYSDAMKTKGEEGLVWTAEALDAYLEGPRDYVPGTKMAFVGLRQEDQRADVIAYLATFAEDGTTSEGGT